MIAVKHLPSLTRISSESLLWLDIRDMAEYIRIGGFVSLFEATLAVPMVTGVVLVPELVTHRESEAVHPIPLVFLFGIGTCGRHPSEVRHDVRISFVLFPLSSELGAESGGVILRLQPSPQ